MKEDIQVKELGHIVLYVRNLQTSVKFYHTVLGWKKINTPANMPIAAFSSGRTHHELLLIEVGDKAAPKTDELQVGLYHFGLKIGDSDEDLKRAIRNLQKHNIHLSGTADHHVTHSLYIEDPDGNEIELYIDVADADWKSNPELITLPTKPLNLS